MIDCVLQEWLERHPNTQFPIHPLIRDGHRVDDYIRGFFPLYKNEELLTRAEEFGYYCSLPNVGLSEPVGKFCSIVVMKGDSSYYHEETNNVVA